MSKHASRTRVALVQAEPAFLDLRASVDRAIAKIVEAAGHGARLVAFGESWLPGYPFWVDVSPNAAAWDDRDIKEVHATLRSQSPTIDGPEVARLREVAADLRVAITMGMHERVERGPGHGTLYNALVTIDGDGSIAVHHRKLVPTHGERLVWGPGDADGLHAADTIAGRVGGLVCWEHWMPLARQALHDSGEQIHVAQWPTVKPDHELASRHYAFEGRCFVLAVGSILRVDALPEALRPAGVSGDALALRGGSCIAGPDGAWIVPPVFDEERTIVADLDLRAIDREVATLDVSGHYARPDVLRLEIVRGRRTPG
jgi:nitrilase